MKKKITCIVLGILLITQSLYALETFKEIYPTVPVIYRVILTSANTEYSQALPPGCHKIMVQCETGFNMKATYTSGESGSNYWTIKADFVYWDNEIDVTGQTIYLQSAEAGVVAEIVVWSD